MPLSNNASKILDVIRSPRTSAYFKLGISVLGVIHAIDNLLEISKKRADSQGA